MPVIQNKQQLAKLLTIIAGLLFTVIAFAQKKLPNPKIGKNETEITLFNLQDGRGFIFNQKALGSQFVFRTPWKKNTKIGAGVLIAADYDDYHKFRSHVFAYGAVFADITQFIGKRQKWSVSGQAGHGIYKRENEFDDAVEKGFNKTTGGMYYAVSINYRVIVSKKILIIISPFDGFRNFRRRSVAEYYSPPSIQRYKYIERHSGPGLRIGIVF
jgi:hypothetical protein